MTAFEGFLEKLHRLLGVGCRLLEVPKIQICEGQLPAQAVGKLFWATAIFQKRA